MTDHERETVEAFRCYMEDAVAHDDRYGPIDRYDLEDESTLATRIEMGPGCWLEVSVHPLIPKVRVAFLTDDRWKNEAIEQAIQETGDSMEAFVGLGLAEAGLDWTKPPVEHGCENDTFFYFATPLEVENFLDLDTEELRNKTLRMLEGYLIAFGPVIILEDE